MKPDNALRLRVESDFSQCALDAAFDIINAHFMEKGLKRSKYRSTLNISVDSEDLIRAIDLARAWGIRLQLKRTYEWDEWSVESFVDGDTSPVILWSGGA